MKLLYSGSFAAFLFFCALSGNAQAQPLTKTQAKRIRQEATKVGTALCECLSIPDNAPREKGEPTGRQDCLPMLDLEKSRVQQSLPWAENSEKAEAIWDEHLYETLRKKGCSVWIEAVKYRK